jgi:hypothetical protein
MKLNFLNDGFSFIMKNILFFILSLLSPVSLAGECGDNDKTVFYCEMKESSLSICSNDYIIYYKHFKKGNLDFLYPENNSNGMFYISNKSYSGGGESRIRFINHDFSYVIFDKLVKREDGGEIFSDFESGIMVVKNNKVLSTKFCDDSSGINENITPHLIKEEFVDFSNFK